MFDLDAIEKDWKENSFCLTDKEIREIYISEGVTTKAYKEKVDELGKMRRYGTADEELIELLFGKPKTSSSDESTSTESTILDDDYWIIDDIDDEDEEAVSAIAEELDKIIEFQMNEIKEQKKELESQTFSFDEYHRRCEELRKTFRLSRESQMKVVEGSMDIVFKAARSYHKEYDKVPIEDFYYAALEGLFVAAKYCLHYATKDCFRAYANSYIRIQIVKYFAKKEHITYRNAYCIDNGYFYGSSDYAKENREKYAIKEFSFDYDKEISYKPSAIYNMTKDNSYDVNYIKDISSEKFMNTYNKAINELDEDDKRIMGLVYDKDGQSLLTNAEVADIAGVPINKVINAKRKVKNRLRKDYRFDKYRGV